MGDIYRNPYRSLVETPIDPCTKFGKNVRVGNNVIIEKDCVIGDDVIIGHNVVIRPETCIGSKSVIGHGVVMEGWTHVGQRTTIHDQSHVTKGAWIGDDVFIAPMFTGANTPNIVHGRKAELVIRPYRIERAVRIGMGAILFPGISIGENAQIGMGAVVTKDVPPGECWFGNPARYHHLVPENELL